MPRSFDIDNLSTGDTILHNFTLDVTVINTGVGTPVSVSVSCPSLAAPPAAVNVPDGANPQLCQFALNHPAGPHTDMTVTVKMEEGAALVDQEDVEEVDITDDTRRITIDPNFFPEAHRDPVPTPGPATPVAGRAAKDIPAGWYTGTYRRPDLGPTVYVMVVRKTAKRQYKLRVLKAAAQFLLPTQVGGQDYRWEVFLPSIPAPAHPKSRLYLRALWVDADGRVRRSATVKV